MAGKLDPLKRTLARIPVRQAIALWARLRIPLTALCLAAGVAAQVWLDKGVRLGLAAAVYALATVLFVGLHRQQALERADAPGGPSSGINWWLVLATAGLGALAWPRLANNTFSASGTALWAGGLLLLALAVWPVRGVAAPGAPVAKPALRRRFAGGIVLDWGHLALIAIVLLGAFYRLYRLGQIPLEMGCDLPHNYANIRMILRHEFPIFFTSYPGREGLFYYLAAPLCSWFGLSHTTIKLTGALLGTLTLPAIYLLGKELYDRQVGLLAALFLSASHWHIIISRLGWRAITVPLVLALMWWALLRALKTQRPAWYALAGALLGLGLYTYNAFMIVPGLVLVMLLTAFITGRGRALLQQWRSVLLLFVVAAFVFLPEGRFAYEQPNAYLYRAATRITDIESALPGDVLATLWGTATRALLMFNYRGDASFAGNVPYLRELSLVAAIAFVLGLAYLLWRWRRGYNLTVLAALAVMLAPSALALAFPGEVPSAVRSIGALPGAMLAAAVGASALWRGLAEHYAGRKPHEVRIALSVAEDRLKPSTTNAADTEIPERPRGLVLRLRWSGAWFWLALAVVAIGAEAQGAYPTYFHDYVRSLPSHNYAISLELARAIDTFYGNGESYIKTWPYWYDGNAVRAQLIRENQSWANEVNDLYPDQMPMAGPPGKFMVILHPDDAAGMERLSSTFPRGVAVQHTDYDGRVAFITFYGER